MTSNKQNPTVIEQLDLEAIKVKLMHQESGEGWSLEHANAIEGEYRRFLQLAKNFPDEQTSPLSDVDTFWHYHILDTAKYAADCQAIFGYFLHHYPYLGLHSASRAERQRVKERTEQLYEQTFGESCLRNQSIASCARADQAAYCAASSQVSYCASSIKHVPSGQAAMAYCAARSPVRSPAALAM